MTLDKQQSGAAVSDQHVGSIHNHGVWDRALAPVLQVEPGTEVTLELLDASGGQIGASDSAEVLSGLDFARLNPCTGPIEVVGLKPGEGLIATIVDISTSRWAWTANLSGFGLLAADFPDPHLWISKVGDGVVETPIGINLGMRPMIGTIGVAPPSSGQYPILVPEVNGGNMDICQIGIGTELHLPVFADGALFSAGDTHALQGDGEVCGTGAETSSTVTVRLDRAMAHHTVSPWLVYDHQPRNARTAATTGIGPDLFKAAVEATRRGVDLVVGHSGLAPIDAYLLLSLVGELRISEIVDAPNWVVTMHIPTSVL